MTAALEVHERGNWSLRHVLIDGEPWFVAIDVCGALGLANVSMAIAPLADDEVSSTEVVDRLGRTQIGRLVSESGLYRIALTSRRPEAEQFRRWVTREVLPELRSTGTYTLAPAPVATTPAPALPPSYAAALRELADTVEQLQQVTDHVDRITPAADAWSALEQGGDDMDVRTAAQWLSTDPAITIGQQRLMRFLRSLGWVDAKNVPYQQHIDNGRMHCKPSRWLDADGKQQTRYTPRVTVKGARELHRLLRKNRLDQQQALPVGGAA